MSLNTLIHSISLDDYPKFIAFLTKKNRRTDVKNIELFKLLYKNELTSNEVCNQLYPNKSKSAYHALRKRLYDSLIDYLAKENLEEENSDKIQVIKYILVARTFFQQEQFQLAFKLLNKAEAIAKEYQLYPYLNEIYHLRIQFSFVNDTENLNQLIFDFKSNQQLYFIEEKLNIVYAKTRQILQQVSYKGEVIDFKTQFNSILKEQNTTINETLSFKSLYQLLTIANISAFMTKNYLQIEAFMLETYELLKDHSNKEKERFYHIQVLYMISNTLFRTKQFEKSISFLKLMEVEILKNKRKYYKTFKLRHDLIYAFNLNYTNQQEEAINTLLPALKTKNNDTETILDIHLALIVFYFQKEDLTNAYRLISKLHHTDGWYTEKAGKEWVLKKNLIEIMLLVDLDKFDLFENRLKRFKRNFKSYLKDIKLEKVLIFLSHLEFYYYNPKEFTSEEYIKKIKESFSNIDTKTEDLIVMSFFAWLKSKLTKEPVYNVTLSFMQ